MKQLCISIIFAALSLSATAQNTYGRTDDKDRIALTPTILKESNVPVAATNTMTSKLAQIASRNGFTTDGSASTFIITAKVTEVSNEVTATSPAMNAVVLDVTLYIGEACSGTLFISHTLNPIKGVGTNISKAYIQAINTIGYNDQNIQEFIAAGKKKILEYYNSNVDFVLKEANALAVQERYNEAIALLNSVPAVCKDARMAAMTVCEEIFQRKIDIEGAKLLNSAQHQWNADPSMVTAEQVVATLSKIHPLSSSIEGASKLSETIGETARKAGVKYWEYQIDTAATPAGREFLKNESIAGISEISAPQAIDSAKNNLNWLK